MEYLSAFGCIGGADSVDEESARPCAPDEYRRRFSRPPAAVAQQFDADGMPVAPVLDATTGPRLSLRGGMRAARGPAVVRAPPECDACVNAGCVNVLSCGTDLDDETTGTLEDFHSGRRVSNTLDEFDANPEASEGEEVESM